jgi:glycolate oxidase FAD binding subunit
VDRSENLVERVREAAEAGQALLVHGGRTKDFYGYPVDGVPLDVSGHDGIVDYDPGELVMTCRAGTRLDRIRELLAEQGQFLPFDPPGFGAEATIGGTVACGFSGPGRPWFGSLRDYLLGTVLINGKGDVARFGGQVMKNVAGYDVSRLMAGSLGTLGVILTVSFKVLPRPARETTLSFCCDEAEAIRRVNEWSGRPLPLSGASWHDGRLMLRLSGANSQVQRAAENLAGDEIIVDSGFWADLREHQLAFFDGDAPLWRLSVPPAAGPLELDGDILVDWGGAQRWYRGECPAEEIRQRATTVLGHATLFRGTNDAPRFQPQTAALQALQSRIRQAFDPQGLFNPGRLAPGA